MRGGFSFSIALVAAEAAAVAIFFCFISLLCRPSKKPQHFDHTNDYKTIFHFHRSKFVEVAALLGSFPNEMASNDSESVDFKLML